MERKYTKHCRPRSTPPPKKGGIIRLYYDNMFIGNINNMKVKVCNDQEFEPMSTEINLWHIISFVKLKSTHRFRFE